MTIVLSSETYPMTSRTLVDLCFNFTNSESTDKPERKWSVNYVEYIDLVAQWVAFIYERHITLINSVYIIIINTKFATYS